MKIIIDSSVQLDRVLEMVDPFKVINVIPIDFLELKRTPSAKIPTLCEIGDC